MGLSDSSHPVPKQGKPLTSCLSGTVERLGKSSSASGLCNLEADCPKTRRKRSSRSGYQVTLPLQPRQTEQSAECHQNCSTDATDTTFFRSELDTCLFFSRLGTGTIKEGSQGLIVVNRHEQEGKQDGVQ